MRAPGFWFDARPGWAAAALSPVSALWALGARRRRQRAPRHRADIPVICVGNAVLGGAGKTPVACDLLDRLTAAGAAPHALSRGYGGRLAGPVRVDPAQHHAADVGDEPLLLARHAPVWVARDRVAGARAAEAAGASHLILDDGFQDPALAYSLRLLVVDARRGFGNGRVFPAGPLREPAADALAAADAILLIGNGVLPGVAADSVDIPVFRARAEPVWDGGAAPARAIAFAGLADPEKFFAMLKSGGVDLAGTKAFPDHHPYRPAELNALAARAEAAKVPLLTTEKDWVRLPVAWQARVRPVPIRLVWADGLAPDQLLQGPEAVAS
jgi:tetraacyldisaccharide 4'-kinase